MARGHRADNDGSVGGRISAHGMGAAVLRLPVKPDGSAAASMRPIHRANRPSPAFRRPDEAVLRIFFYFPFDKMQFPDYTYQSETHPLHRKGGTIWVMMLL